MRTIVLSTLLLLLASPIAWSQSVTLPSFGPAAPKRAKVSPPPPTPPPVKESEAGRLSSPPPQGTWKVALQSVAVRVGGKTNYTSFYYEAPTGRSIDEPMPLPAGGSIVGVFPDDCPFRVQDQSGHSFTFKDEAEAKAKTLRPGTWSLFPIKCGGVVLFVK